MEPDMFTNFNYHCNIMENPEHCLVWHNNLTLCLMATDLLLINAVITSMEHWYVFNCCRVCALSC